jgi:hypothetical protein
VSARRRRLLVTLVLLLSAAGCGKQAPPPAPAEPRGEPPRPEEVSEALVARTALRLDTAGSPHSARGGAERSA